jgi:hypothetical protein
VGHHIIALVLPRSFDASAAARFDLRPVPLPQSLTMFHIDHYFTAYWQAVRGERGWLDVPPGLPSIFPCEAVVRTMARELAASPAPAFAVVMTEYFGGVGGQWACTYVGEVRSKDVKTINDALRALGVVRTGDLDEFDTVGLGDHRHQPDDLDRYIALCDELGV